MMDGRTSLALNGTLEPGMGLCVELTPDHTVRGLLIAALAIDNKDGPFGHINGMTWMDYLK